jgi:hypothetical protein
VLEYVDGMLRPLSVNTACILFHLIFKHSVKALFRSENGNTEGKVTCLLWVVSDGAISLISTI